MANITDEVVEGEIVSLIDLESQLETTRNELIAQDQRLAQFFEMEKQIKETSKALRERIIDGMVEIGKKTIEIGDYRITVYERKSYDIDHDKLSEEFYKLQPDTKKIGAACELYGEPPEGVAIKYSRNLKTTKKRSK